jgi:tetratricopeptide (TPR) repeat protein
MDWYRRKTWTKDDEEEFFNKLGRARKDGRAQYLLIQAIELVETEKQELLKVAEALLNKMLTEFPDDNFSKGKALHTLGDICKSFGDFIQAINYYKQALDFEEIYPNVKTNAYLGYAELIVKTAKVDEYESVERILVERIPDLLFPVAKYEAYSVLSIICNYKGRVHEAKKYAALAEQNARAQTSGLRYHKGLGVVKERDSWLDRQIKKITGSKIGS